MSELLSKSVFGYPMIFDKKGDQCIVRIDELGISEKSQSRGRAIRNVFDRIKEITKLDLIEPKTKDSHIEKQDEIQIKMFKLNQKLINFGFSIIVENISENDIEKLEKVCDEINLNENYTTKEIEVIENKIINIIIPYILDTKHRALNMTSLIMKTNHISKFSHLIEQSYISLFRGEYISTVMVLIPVIEGVLLSLYGFDFSSGSKPKEHQLLNKWAELQINTKNSNLVDQYIIDEYIRAFIEIWENTVFTKHQLAEAKLYFNRNYITHLMGEGRFYSRNNAFKLINLIDLLAYVLSACSENENSSDINVEDYHIREIYYESLLSKQIINKIEYNILNGHENFKGYI
ncbi:MAG: hypothetical protein RRZ84_08185 [Romboutsia sp.]